MAWTVNDQVLCTYSPATQGSPLTNATLNSVNAPTALNAILAGNIGWRVEGTTKPYGGRWVLPSGPHDVSSKKYMVAWWSPYDNAGSMEEGAAQDNIRIYFYDSSGNYKGHNVWGKPVGGGADSGIPFVGRHKVTNSVSIIDRDAPADYSSGVLDWTDLVGWEVHYTHATRTSHIYLAGLVSADLPIYTGTVDMDELFDPLNVTFYEDKWASIPVDGYPDYLNANGLVDDVLRPIYNGYSQQIYSTIFPGFQIGDGSTTTTFDQTAKGLSWNNPHDDEAAGILTCSRLVVLDHLRFIHVNQSASCSFLFTDSVISSSSSWELTILGSSSGTCIFTRCSFFNGDYIILAHSSLIDSTLENCGYLEIDANSVVTGSTLRNNDNAADKGLYTQAAPGDYSAIDIALNNNLGKDITINPTTAGTYDFTGISSTGAIVVHNESATHAITVSLPAGVSASGTTAGGGITISSPQTSATIAVNVTGAEITILDTGTQTEQYHVETGGATQDFDFTAPIGNNVDILVFKPGYRQFVLLDHDLGSADSTITANLVAVPSYA